MSKLEQLLNKGLEITIQKSDDGSYYADAVDGGGRIEGYGETLKESIESLFVAVTKELMRREREISLEEDNE